MGITDRRINNWPRSISWKTTQPGKMQEDEISQVVIWMPTGHPGTSSRKISTGEFFIKMDVVASTWPLLEPKNAVTFYTFDSKTIWYVYPCFQRQSDITHNPTCENQIYNSNSIANALELVLHKALKICLSLHREFQYSNVALLAQKR